MSEVKAEMQLPEIEAYLQSMRGPVGAPDSMPIEQVSVRRMALAVENFDPIHYDDAAARARGYRGIVAPWPLLWLVFFNCREGTLKFPFGKATIHGEDGYEFHEPIIVGDTITVTTSIADTSIKQGKSGVMGVVVMRREFRNQHGQLCAVMSTTNLRR
jgi:acyl dehydratase